MVVSVDFNIIKENIPVGGANAITSKPYVVTVFVGKYEVFDRKAVPFEYPIKIFTAK